MKTDSQDPSRLVLLKCEPRVELILDLSRRIQMLEDLLLAARGIRRRAGEAMSTAQDTTWDLEGLVWR